MLGQNVITGATDILVAAGHHRKDNDGGGGARCSIECIPLAGYLFICKHAWLVIDGPHMTCMLHH
jgi:hypothetical protein